MKVNKISEITPGMDGIEVTGIVVKIEQPRIIETRFGPAKYTAAILMDESGSIRLNLWRWQVDAVKVGDLVKLVNAFATKFKDRVELNLGRRGRIIVLKRGESS